MAPCHSTRSATTQASSITPTESASLSVATHEIHSESHKRGTSAANLTAQPPTKKQATTNKPITDNEESENVQEKQKTSEKKRAEDTAADEEGVLDLTVTERVLEESSLPVAPPKQGPSSNVPQLAAPVFTVTHKQHSDMKKVEEEHESDGHETNNESENKENTEGSTDGSNAGHGNESEHSDEDHTSKNKGSDISIISSKSNSNRTEDRTSKDKELDIIMNSPPVSPPHTKCTQPYRETQDSLPNESATVKMVVIDGIVMGPQALCI
ncbi:hypothetical protein BDQ17DRAFT_1435674 [Cyathus striatus]|nr:hypothetical protein BDQ17DRAFT_1435674 [Cyathus striatus]